MLYDDHYYDEIKLNLQLLVIVHSVMNTSNLKWTTGAGKWKSYVNVLNLIHTQPSLHIYMDSSISLHISCTHWPTEENT